MSAELLRGFEAGKDVLIADLRALVEMESPSDDAARVSSLAAWTAARLRDAGVAARTVSCPPRGDAVLAGAACDASAQGLGALLMGHIDTVWPVGSLAELPFHVDARGHATGPGIFDMKAGVAVAIAALSHLGGRGRASLLLVSDEEVGTFACRPLLREVALRHRAVLVLEPSLDGAVKIARKGVGTFTAHFAGRAAHAGLDPERGASSLVEMARYTLFAAGLGDAALGTTVTPTVANAGTTLNVVPEKASLIIDARVWQAGEAARVTEALRGYQPHDNRVRLTLEGGFDRPPLEDTDASRSLYARAQDIAAAMGVELKAARVGGASDGNLTAEAGVPTLDGLGPRGNGAHARDEYVETSDLPFRAALIAAIAGGF